MVTITVPPSLTPSFTPSPSLQKLFLGIDPGKKGSMVLIWGDHIQVWKMPEDEYSIHAILRCPKANLAVIEDVHSFPKQGVVSSFTFGKGYGFLRGCLTALGIPFREVTPSVWQRAMGISPKRRDETKRDFKKRIQGVAQQLYPNVKIHLDVADAVLIARYASTLK